MVRKGTWLVLDQAYEHFVHDGAKHTSVCAERYVLLAGTATLRVAGHLSLQFVTLFGHRLVPKMPLEHAPRLR
jgi:hypothetical protein